MWIDYCTVFEIKICIVLVFWEGEANNPIQALSFFPKLVHWPLDSWQRVHVFSSNNIFYFA